MKYNASSTELKSVDQNWVVVTSEFFKSYNKKVTLYSYKHKYKNIHENENTEFK